MTEHAIFLDSPGDYREGHVRVYLGNEFCQKLIPTLEEVEAFDAFCRDKGLRLTLVTPGLTEAGLRRLAALLAGVEGCETLDEVVFNDWGAFRLLQGRPWSPVLGRLHSRQVRDPRLGGGLDPDSVRPYLNRAFVAFLEGRGVRRLELDVPPQGLRLDPSQAGSLRLSVYVPYGYVTTTRFCPMPYLEDPAQAPPRRVPDCRRECRERTFALSNPSCPVPLFFKGNTLFYDGGEWTGHDLVDRVVFQPRLPWAGRTP